MNPVTTKYKDFDILEINEEVEYEDNDDKKDDLNPYAKMESEYGSWENDAQSNNNRNLLTLIIFKMCLILL